MLIDIVTIFPGMYQPVLGESIIKRAQEKGLAKIRVHDLRDFSQDKHKKVDDASYGGGGMVFCCDPLFTAVETILGTPVYPPPAKPDTKKRIILMSPRGTRITQKELHRYTSYERLILIAPRYEGVDERVAEHAAEEEISLGDYILSGGELASMVFVDALIRLLPGVVSDIESIQNESFETGILDYSHYTRPETFRGLTVPAVLTGGNTAAIAQWRKQNALETTRRFRPDLLAYKDHT